MLAIFSARIEEIAAFQYNAMIILHLILHSAVHIYDFQIFKT